MIDIRKAVARALAKKRNQRSMMANADRGITDADYEDADAAVAAHIDAIMVPTAAMDELTEWCRKLRASDGSDERYHAGECYDAGLAIDIILSQHRKSKPSSVCALGVGCDEAGICYAAAHNQPEKCGAALRQSQPAPSEPTRPALDPYTLEQAALAVRSVEIPKTGLGDKIDAWLKALDMSEFAVRALSKRTPKP